MKVTKRHFIEEHLSIITLIMFQAGVMSIASCVIRWLQRLLNFALPKFLALEPVAYDYAPSSTIGIIIGMVFLILFAYYSSYHLERKLRWLFWLLTVASSTIVVALVTTFAVGCTKLGTLDIAAKLCWISATMLAGIVADLLVVFIAAIAISIVFIITIIKDRDLFLGPGDL